MRGALAALALLLFGECGAASGGRASEKDGCPVWRAVTMRRRTGDALCDLRWALLNESHISIEVSAVTDGYLGFAVSPDGKMSGDCVVGSTVRGSCVW